MPLGRKKGKPGPSSREHEQAQLLAELAVVTLLGLFDAAEGKSSSSSLLREGDAIDALEHLPVAVARASKRLQELSSLKPLRLTRPV